MTEVNRQHLLLLEQDLAYWQNWAKYEQEAIDKCEHIETLPYLEHRLAMAKRNIVELQKALEVFNDTPADMGDSPSAMGSGTEGAIEGEEAKEVV